MEAPEKLKPCPFCGGSAVPAPAPNGEIPLYGCFDCDMWADTTEQWNTRAHMEGDTVVQLNSDKVVYRFTDGEKATFIRDYLCTMPGELVEDLYKVASAWLRHIDRQKERAETLTRAASLAKKGDIEGARRLKAQVDRAPRVYDGANMEPAMRKYTAWHEGKG